MAESFDYEIIDKAYAKDGEAYWQTASTMNSPLLEQSSNAIRIAEQKEKIAKSDLLLYENFSPEKMNGFVMDAIHG